jgi:RND family efflux transporter MFP subunit
MIGEPRSGRKRSSLWKWVAGGILLVALAILIIYTGSFVIHYYPKVSRRTRKPLPVEVSRVEVRDLVETVGASTVTVPFREVDVRAEVQGTVKEILFKIGQLVSPKALVVRLDDQEYQAALHRAVAALKSASEQLAFASRTLSRFRPLYEQHLIPLAQLEKYEKDVVAAQATQAEAQKDLVTARRELAATKIYSPIHGVFLSENIHVSEYVAQNAQLVSLGQITPILAEAKVPEEKLKAVSVGQEAQVSFDAFPGQNFTGKVLKIGPKVDPTTRTFSAFVELPNQDQTLSLGLTGFTRMSHKLRGLAVPTIAVINLFSNPVLFVVNDHVVSLRRITPGGQAAGYILVREGLSAGEEVVVTGQRYLKEGDRIKIGPK